MTEEQALAQATQEIEDAKPMMKQVNNEVSEFSSSDYEQAIEDRKNSLLNHYNFGYIQARQEAYGSVQDQLDMQYWIVSMAQPLGQNILHQLKKIIQNLNKLS